jgi:hypothetical protein
MCNERKAQGQSQGPVPELMTAALPACRALRWPQQQPSQHLQQPAGRPATRPVMMDAQGTTTLGV